MAEKWNPDLYLKFQRERTQPSMDLVNRIELESPEAILDLGCGPGNSTAVLARRWPGVRLTGVDNSEEMIAKARADHPEWNWLLTNARELTPSPSYDLVYSNAAIQWIPGHDTLVPMLFAMVRPGGALAVQVPMREGMPVRGIIESVARQPRFRGATEEATSPLVFHEPGFYYDLLAQTGADRITLWDTTYRHEMESHEMIVEMMRSTGMRPYLERLASESERDAFLAAVLDGVEREYPAHPNGRVLYGFHRLFFVAYRGTDE